MLVNCSAVSKTIKHGKLDVQTKMSDTIFLDPVTDHQKTVYLQIKNTSDKQNIDIKSIIECNLQSKGYTIVSNLEKAHYLLQANILQVGKNNRDNPFEALTSGFGGALAGGTIGGLAGLSGGYDAHYTGAAVGSLVGGAVSFLADAAVSVVNYSMTTDLQLSERNKTNSWNKYKTRIISVATKTNLKFNTAMPRLTQDLAHSIAGLL
jgi:hypothetical protein